MTQSRWVDFHSHIIPCVDDGVQTPEESQQVLAALEEQGVSEVFCTSHLNSVSVPCQTTDTLRDAYSDMHVSPEYSLPIRTRFGSEFYWDPRIHNRRHFHPIPMGHSRYVLMELPYEADFAMVKKAAEDCIWNDYLPVIAHAERDDAFQHQADETLAWAAQCNVLLQLNAFDLTLAQAQKESGKAAWRIVESGMATFLGSDTHGIKRPPVYKEGAEALLKWGEVQRREEYVENILWRNASTKILDTRGILFGDMPVAHSGYTRFTRSDGKNDQPFWMTFSMWLHPIIITHNYRETNLPPSLIALIDAWKAKATEEMKTYVPVCPEKHAALKFIYGYELYEIDPYVIGSSQEHFCGFSLRMERELLALGSPYANYVGSID